jgi:hypothetical protein
MLNLYRLTNSITLKYKNESNLNLREDYAYYNSVPVFNNYGYQPIKKKVDKSQFKNMKYRDIDDITDLEKQTECTICRAEFHGDDKITLLNCNHFFCEDCIKLWLDKFKNTCPICRKSY